MRSVLMLSAVLLLSCGTSNGFRNDNYCPEGNCTQCSADTDCVVVVDCCGERNICLHREDSVSICRMACPEGENRPEVACVDGQCKCR